MGLDFTENLDIYKITNFDELQNLFDITKKLVFFKQSEILNMNMIECTFPSWTRSTLSHDQVIQWTKATSTCLLRLRTVSGEDVVSQRSSYKTAKWKNSNGRSQMS